MPRIATGSALYAMSLPSHIRQLGRRPLSIRRERWLPTSDSRCSCARATCSADAAWASFTTMASWSAIWPRRPRSRRIIRCISTASLREQWSWTLTPCATAPRPMSARSWSTSRWRASIPATRRAARRRSRSRTPFRRSCVPSLAAWRSVWAWWACSTSSLPSRTRSST